MPMRRAFVVGLLSLFALAFANSAAAQETLADVRIEGTTTYADIVRIVLESRPGRGIDSIDLEAERNRVYSTGSFSEVSVSLQDDAQGPVLLISVEENPRIAEIAFDGNGAVGDEALASALAREHLLAPGNVLNTVRAEEALATIQRLYRQRGFPFDVPVTLDIQEVDAEGGGVASRLVYTVEEAARVDEVVVEDSEVLDTDQVAMLFNPLVATGEFDFSRYQQAVTRVQELYRERGHRASGVDVATTSLQNGLLDIGLHEARIASLDTSAIGVDPGDLTVAAGDLFNYDLLLEDVRRVAQGRSGDIRLLTSLTQAGDVLVRFEVGPPETAGPVERIEFEGNTVLSDEELRDVLAMEVGDTFTSTLAREDFDRIVRRYAVDGWVVVNQPDFSYVDGTYVQRVTEVQVVGFDVTFEGERDNTQDFVITRYMPEVGSVLNQNEIRAGLQRIARLGAVEPVNALVQPTDDPSQVRMEVIVRAARTGLFTPSAQYATDSGFSASVSFSESNFLGRAHNIGAELNAQSSDLGFQLGGSVRYSIPWLYIDVADFQEVPTSVTGSLFSLVNTNQILSANGSTTVTYPGLPAVEENRVRVGEYTQRDTGASLSVGRPVAEDTTLRFSARASVAQYKLEPPAVECTFDETGDLENAQRCALPEEESAQYLPQGGLNSFVSTSVNFDDRDSADFPRRGMAASALFGVGFGNDYRSPETGDQASYLYQQLEFGARTYLVLSEVMPQEFEDPNHVLAFRVNIGHQFGVDYPFSRRFQVGKTTDESTAIRGYQADDFDLSRTYATGSVEYRYDFGFDTAATETVVGILFVDAGYASNVPGFDEYSAPLFMGAGVGLQVNLGFGGVNLPALRFDYGFSERNPGGEFRFRVGPVF